VKRDNRKARKKEQKGENKKKGPWLDVKRDFPAFSDQICS
jgi:hypothetical protein